MFYVMLCNWTLPSISILELYSLLVLSISLHQQKLDVFTKLNLPAPPEGHPRDCSLESRVYMLMPDGQVIIVPVKRDSLVSDVLSLACKVIHQSEIVTWTHEQLKFMR